MKITVWGINYSPESIGIAPFNRELCEYLAGRGHEVSAVTSFPYYPHWRKSPEDCGQWHRAETIGGVHVHRCWCYVPETVTSLRRMAHELSFGVVSLWQILIRPRADVYVVVSPPLGLGFFAWIATTLKSSRYVFHVQDLQPDAAVGLGMLKHGPLVKLLYGLERLAYAKAAKVSGISGGMMRAFQRKGVPETKRVLLPNWLRKTGSVPAAAANRADARRFFGIPDGARLGVYAGNLGRKQSLEIIVEAAALLANLPAAETARIRIIIAGDGAARADLETRLKAQPNAAVQLLPLLSDEDYGRLLRAADVAIITQAAGTGQFFFPSKLLSVLAAGLPVLAVADADSELAAAVEAGGFGCTVKPGDAPGFARVLKSLADSGNALEAWAERTRWVQQFSTEAILPRFEQMLLSVGRSSAANPVEKPMASLLL